MRPIDADEFMEQYNLKDATKYGNKDAEQQNHSYSTLYLYELADMIDDAPTIDLPGKWIPCSERMPEESLNSVIGWDEYRNRCVFVQYYCGRWILGNDEGVKIIAWMPLPEPYREGGI